MFSPFGFMGTQAGGGGDADATAYINEVISQGGSLSSGEQTAIQTLYTDLKSNSLYSEMVFMYPLMGGTPDSHKVEGLAPNDANTLLTWYGGISQSLAHTSAGVDKTIANSYGYGANNIIIQDMGSWDINNACLGGYVSTAITNDLGFLISSTTSAGGETRFQLNTPYDNNLVYGGIGEPNFSPYNNGSPPIGRWVISRTSQFLIRLFKNGTQVSENTSDNNLGYMPPGANLSLFSSNGYINAINSWDGVCGFMWGAVGLDNTQVSTLDGILATYLTSIGR
ncbi:hypothetical protein [Shewanella sp.]|uniref:hypothetical protein n=1 Tax=Shewanella sp. TaxID=50422 RepID=UPI004047169F